MVSEGSGCSAFSTCRCAGLVECGECLFSVERLGAGGAADDMDEGGAWMAGAVGQVLDCPGRLAFARRSTACLGRTAGGHVFVGDARDGAVRVPGSPRLGARPVPHRHRRRPAI